MLSDKAIEEYQIILMRNPSARVFAPLSEAYRKMGLLQQALEICEKGTHYNQDYHSGWVAYGKVLFELKRYEEAVAALSQATGLNKDNILAYKLKALSLIKLNKYANALSCYKHVLFLSPQDAQAQKFIKNWEYLESADYSPQSFAMEDSEENDWLKTSEPAQISAFVEALIVRNELARAETMLRTAITQWPEDTLLNRQLEVVVEFKTDENRSHTEKQLHENKIKKAFFSRLLRRIESVNY